MMKRQAAVLRQAFLRFSSRVYMCARFLFSRATKLMECQNKERATNERDGEALRKGRRMAEQYETIGERAFITSKRSLS